MQAKKIDIDKIKNNLSRWGRRGNANNQPRKQVFWTPPDYGDGSKTYRVYLLPWKDENGEFCFDEPFKFYWYHFNLGGALGKDGRLYKNKKQLDAKGIEVEKYYKAPLQLRQFGESDPVESIIRALLDEGTDVAKEAARKLYPSQVAMVPVIVAGEEEKGPLIWKISSKGAFEMLSEQFGMVDDWGLLNDPENERWVRITVKKEEGKKPPLDKKISQVVPEPKNAPLSHSSEQIEKWLNSVPDVAEAVKDHKYSAEVLSMLVDALSKFGEPDDESQETEAEEKTVKANKKMDDSSESKPSKKQASVSTSSRKEKSREDALAELQDILNEDDDDE